MVSVNAAFIPAPAFLSVNAHTTSGNSITVALDMAAGTNLVLPSAVPPDATRHPVNVQVHGVGGGTATATTAAEICMCIDETDHCSCHTALIVPSVALPGVDLLLGFADVASMGVSISPTRVSIAGQPTTLGSAPPSLALPSPAPHPATMTHIAATVADTTVQANPIATLPSLEASHSGHRPTLVTPTESTRRARIHIAATNARIVAQHVAFITDRALQLWTCDENAEANLALVMGPAILGAATALVGTINHDARAALIIAILEAVAAHAPAPPAEPSEESQRQPHQHVTLAALGFSVDQARSTAPMITSETLFNNNWSTPATAAVIVPDIVAAQATAPPITSEELGFTEVSPIDQQLDTDFDKFCYPALNPDVDFDIKYEAKIMEQVAQSNFHHKAQEVYLAIMRDPAVRLRYREDASSFQAGELALPPVRYHVADGPSVIDPQRYVSDPADLAFMHGVRDQQLVAGVIRPATAAEQENMRFLSNTHCAKRLDDTGAVVRRCTLDTKPTLNRFITVDGPTVMPRISEQHEFGYGVTIQSLDDGQGYFWQRKLELESQVLTAHHFPGDSQIYVYQVQAMG
jgi:hypothetical protein